MYYLQTRYYDPELCRFISQDSVDYADPEKINGLNLYAYCANNPVMNVDPTGHIFFAILLTLLLGAVISGVCEGVASLATGGDFWAGFAGGLVSGFISTIGICLSVVTGGVGGLVIAGIFGFAAGFSGNIVQQGIEKGWNNIDWGSAIISGGISAVMNIMTYGATNFAMRNSVGIFEKIFDKSIKFAKRFVNALAMSVESYICTMMFTIPVAIGQGIMDFVLGLYYNGKI